MIRVGVNLLKREEGGGGVAAIPNRRDHPVGGDV